MKRLWSRGGTSKRSSVLWLCNAVAVLIFTLSPLFVMAPASAKVAPVGGGGGNVPGGGVITATFLDASHIGIQASGNISFSYHDSQGNAFNVTTSLYPMQGVYYGAVSQYPSWGTGYGGTQPNAGLNYWFDNNQTNPGGSVCNGHNSNVQITSFDQSTGDATANIWIRIPVVDAQSTDQTPTCEPIGTSYPGGTDTDGYEIQNIPILNVNTGLGSLKSFDVTSTASGGNCTVGGAKNGTGCGPAETINTYNTLNLAGVASSANFYVADSSDVYASVYDPSMNANGGTGGQQMYEFTNPTKNSDGSTTYHQGVGGYVSQECPDALTIPKGETGDFIKGTYSTWLNSGSTGCASTNISKPAATYPIMILNMTPEAYLSSLTGVETTTGGGGAGGASTTQLVDCTAGAGSGFFTSVLNWILCGAINLALGTANLMQGWINSALKINVSSIFDTTTSSGAGYFSVWSRFRDIAVGLFVIGALMLIAAKAFGIELFSAHDERKLLARFPIAIILMTLSWQGLAWIYKLDNIVQTDLPNIVYSGFSGLTAANVGPGANLFAILGAGAVVFTLGPATLTLLLTALVALGAGLLALLIRNGLLTIFAVTACIPIGLWAIPLEAVQKVPKLVKDEGIGLLVVGPAIGLLFPFFRILAYVAVQQGGILGDISGVGLDIIPCFLVLGLVQQAGRLTAMGTGFIQKGSQGIQGSLSGVRQRAKEKNLKDAGNYSRFSDNTKLGRGLNTVTGAAFHPMRDARRGRSGIQQGRQAGRAAMGAEAMKNDAVFAANAHDDSFLYALAAGEDRTKQKAAALRATGKAEDAASADMLVQGMATARAVKDHDSAGVRMAAFGALTQTGYQIADGEKGYNEMSAIATDLTGGTASSGDSGAYRRAMDNAQYNMGNAGRFDVAGVNHGAGYNRDLGLNKADPYSIGRGKKQTVTSLRESIEEHASRGAQLAAAGDTKGAAEQFTRASQFKQEIQGLAQSAKGDVRDKAEEAAKALAPTASAEAAALDAWEKTPVAGQKIKTAAVRVDYEPAKHAGWSQTEKDRGWRTEQQVVPLKTNKEVAAQWARTSRMPREDEP